LWLCTNLTSPQNFSKDLGLRELQMMIWEIEMRNHPAFRDHWAVEVQATLKYILCAGTNRTFATERTEDSET